MRKIDADALKEEFRKIYHCAEKMEDLANAMEDAINNAPTVCGNNPKWCESCVSKGKCASTRPTRKARTSK